MNKKKLMVFSMIGIFALAIVSAGVLTYYGYFQQEIEVKSPIIISSEISDMINDVWAGVGGIRMGEPVTISNIAPIEVEVEISNNNEAENIDVSYAGELTMVEKNTATWVPVEGGVSKTITYTVVGDDFIVNEIPDGYTLIYYPNTDDAWPINVDSIKVLSEGINSIENLPIASDIGDDYCGNGYNPYATQCVGAKLWLIPGELSLEDAISAVKVWGNYPTFLFETELIQYNTEGNIVMSPGSSLTITPVYDIDSSYIGTTTITTYIKPVVA